MRPIVNRIKSPSYKICKFLQQYVRFTLKLQHLYTTTNTNQLVNKLNNLKVTKNTKMLSLDIENLCTNILINVTINIIENKLLRSTN